MTNLQDLNIALVEMSILPDFNIVGVGGDFNSTIFKIALVEMSIFRKQWKVVVTRSLLLVEMSKPQHRNLIKEKVCRHHLPEI